MDVNMSTFIKLCTLTLFKLLYVNKVRLKLIIAALYIWCKLTVVSHKEEIWYFVNRFITLKLLGLYIFIGMDDRHRMG